MSALHKAVNALANAPALLLPRKRSAAAAPAPVPDSASASRRSSMPSTASDAPPAKAHRTERRHAVQPWKDGSLLFQGLTSIPLDQRLRAAGETEHQTACRCAVAPLWSLVGTFKVAMASVVDVDLAGERSIKWHQRNPKGGFIAMRVGLQLVTDVSLAKVSLEDHHMSETHYTVVIKTASGKPSQVVFGFSSLREATRLKALLKENK